ncbi:NAD(+) synthase [Pendulispora brunnea]|uniref:NH(3)-dependent NAD(+) synthetase n=1 Tax=Pendulispora brunnea TaxID=2905690 RepID=A0ABZ2KQ84_9BACT
MSPDLQSLLALVRASRGFQIREVAEAKLGRLAQWFSSEAIDAAVVGVSGGIDSALVLALLRALEERGILRRVVALLLPIHALGATRQEEATARGRRVAEALGAEAWEAPLTRAHAATLDALAAASGLSFDAWSDGQALSVARTPALYGAAALLQTHGYRSIVCGTTNRDEGAYLGFFGKASDGMVDLQPISDLHKSEVRALAAHFHVPKDVVAAVPTGDVHDGRSDEEMLGVSYDAVELYLRLLELGRDATVADPHGAIARQHALNAHKYRVGNPAVHLDVMPRGVPGGWSDEPLAPRTERRPAQSTIPGAWDPPPIDLEPSPLARLSFGEPLAGVEGFALRVPEVLTPADCTALCDAMAQSGIAEPVDVTGIPSARHAEGVGSTRATAWSPELARALWARLAPAVPSVRFLGATTPTDGFATTKRASHRTWRVVGLSPLLRFMRYERGGRHFGHYDAAFDYGDGRRTLLSVVFYLRGAAGSGATRFLRDGQEGLPTDERNFDDWTREARDDEIVVAVAPLLGDALVFDHRLCHDVQQWEGPDARIVIRADVVYEAVPDGRST